MAEDKEESRVLAKSREMPWMRAAEAAIRRADDSAALSLAVNEPLLD